MTTQLTLEACGEMIPVRRMNEMAQQISKGIAGNKVVTFTGFDCYRPQPLVADGIRETHEQVA